MTIINEYSKLSQTTVVRKERKGYSTTDQINSTCLSYMSLRRMIGFLGILLPLILIFGTYISGNDFILPSISDYFYTTMRTIFTGLLIAISLFLWYYNSTEFTELLLVRIAAISASLVAIFPTSVLPNYLIEDNVTYFKENFEGFIIPSIQGASFVKNIHYFSAALFFVLLIILVLKYFIEAEKNGEKSKKRILFYKICGFGMIISILSVIIAPFIFKDAKSWTFPLTFSCETIALLLFGLSWLIKGEAEELLYRAQHKLKNAHCIL